MGAGTWFLARPPVAVPLPRAAFGSPGAGDGADLALPACLGGILALCSHIPCPCCPQGWQEGCPSAHTPRGCFGLSVSASFSSCIPLLPSPELLPCPCSSHWVCVLLHPFLQKATASDLGPSCSHCKKIFGILTSFSHF